MKAYKEEYPELYQTLINAIEGKFEVDLSLLPRYEVNSKAATRNVGGKIIQTLSNTFPTLIGGSADLTKSTKAKGIDGDFDYNNRIGRNINFGVREHAMAAIVNGLTLHGGIRAFGGGFFVFSDYMKPSLRLAALMQIPSIFIFTHDSVAVGEDGPTHQPIEQLAMLRATPNLNVIRPADANETNFAFKIALESKETPTCIVLTRQDLVNLENTNNEDVIKGGYIVSKEKGELDGIILASGSEVSLALQAQKALENENIYVRVVSMPCVNLFEKQSIAYKEFVLPSKVQKRLALEMSSDSIWYKYASNVFGINRFGESGKLNEVLDYFGFSEENIVKVYKNIK